MNSAPLEGPRSADELYLARAADGYGVPLLRPVMTGDVFREIVIPGVDSTTGDEGGLAIIVSHPCSMRRGAILDTHVQMIRVLKCEPIHIEAWPKLYYDRVPLPDLTVVIDPDDVTSDDPEAEIAVRTQEGAHAGFLNLRGRVPSDELHLHRRIACMTEQGVAFLHQRMAHNDTRYAPEIENLIAVCAPVFAEIELLEQWNEHLIDPDVLNDVDKLDAELTRIAGEFDAELSAKRVISNKKNGYYTLRADLSLTKRHAAARREILKLLNARSAVLSFAGLSMG
jgi:hypothetical protein